MFSTMSVDRGKRVDFKSQLIDFLRFLVPQTLTMYSRLNCIKEYTLKPCILDILDINIKKKKKKWDDLCSEQTT